MNHKTRNLENSPVVPVSAQLKYNIDVLCDYICNYIPLPLRDFTESPRMIVIRSFDVNNPGCEVRNLLLYKEIVFLTILLYKEIVFLTILLGRCLERRCLRRIINSRCAQA